MPELTRAAFLKQLALAMEQRASGPGVQEPELSNQFASAQDLAGQFTEPAQARSMPIHGVQTPSGVASRGRIIYYPSIAGRQPIGGGIAFDLSEELTGEKNEAPGLDDSTGDPTRRRIPYEPKVKVKKDGTGATLPLPGNKDIDLGAPSSVTVGGLSISLFANLPADPHPLTTFQTTKGGDTVTIERGGPIILLSFPVESCKIVRFARSCAEITLCSFSRSNAGGLKPPNCDPSDLSKLPFHPDPDAKDVHTAADYVKSATSSSGFLKDAAGKVRAVLDRPGPIGIQDGRRFDIDQQKVYYISDYKIKAEGWIIIYCGGESPAVATYWCYEASVSYKCKAPGLGSRTAYSNSWCGNKPPQIFAWGDPNFKDLQDKAEGGFKSAFGGGTKGALQ